VSGGVLFFGDGKKQVSLSQVQNPQGSVGKGAVVCFAHQLRFAFFEYQYGVPNGPPAPLTIGAFAGNKTEYQSTRVQRGGKDASRATPQRHGV
jgi:hypothetical protein